MAERAPAGRGNDADADGATVPSRSELPPLPPITAPQQYQMQFTTCEEHAQLVERAKALLARARPGMSLGELHFEAMKLLVAALEKKKFAVTDRPRMELDHSRTELDHSRTELDHSRTELDHSRTELDHSGTELDHSRTELDHSRTELDHSRTELDHSRTELDHSRTELDHSRTELDHSRTELETEVRAPQDPSEVESPRRRVVTRGRYVPAAVRRWVYERDRGQCSYIDERGVRCTEIHYLELHHIDPFAKGGEHRVNNLSLRCAAHNAWAAEQDFGREAIMRKRDAARHESFKAQVVDVRTSDPDD